MMSIARATGKRMIIIGGGLSGLSYLHYLRNFTIAFQKTGILSQITLVESNNYMGGSIKSQVFDDGIVHELGPRSIRNAGPVSNNTCLLIEELGLKDNILSMTHKSSASKDRYIYNHGKLVASNFSLANAFRRLPFCDTSLARAIYHDLFKADKLNLEDFPHQDPPLYNFIAHRFGEGVAENLLDPLIRGITAGDVRNTSTRGMFEAFLLREQLYGSVIKGAFKANPIEIEQDKLLQKQMVETKLLSEFSKDKVLSYSLEIGLQSIADHLCNSLLNTNEDGLISIYNQTKATSIEFGASEAPCLVTLETTDGEQLKIAADYIVSAIPANQLAKILANSNSSEILDAFKTLSCIPHVPVGCVALEYRGIDREKLPKAMQSFGFLAHSKSDSKLLGISFDSSSFPKNDDKVKAFRMTCMMGGAWFEKVFGTDNPDNVDDSQLEQTALEEVRKILDFRQDPYRVTPILWKTGIAQYRPGHKTKLEDMRKKIENLSLPISLIGQSYDGVSINDVAFYARKAAHEFVKTL